MFITIIIALIGLLGLSVLIAGFFAKDLDGVSGPPKGGVLGVGAGILVVAGVITFFSSSYTQDPGQANVLRSWTGEIQGYETAEGFHWKAPWVDTITFDVRNQRVVYAGASGNQSDNSGGTADGAQITVQDKDGVSSNIDIAVRYSIEPDAVVGIYRAYLNEENLRNRLIFNDIRSVVRSVPGQFSTLELLTNREDVQVAITKALEAKWEKAGLIVDEVSLQEIRVPDSVKAAYDKAQEAQIGVTTAENNLRSAEVKSQEKVVQAQAEAEANRLLSESLTPQVLEQRRIDALLKAAENDNLIITDGTGSGVFINR